MDLAEVKALYDRYVIANYGRFPVNIVRAEGSYVWDSAGRRYLDLIPGLGSSVLGHCPPRVVQAVEVQARQLLHTHNHYYWESQGRAARYLVEKSFGADSGARVFFCNSGTEATEAALKLARLYGGQKRRTIVSAQNSFHGRTWGALSATGQENFQKGLEPMVPGFRHVPFNDAAALQQVLEKDDSVCAVLLEPVQGEGGIYPALPGYLQAVRRMTREKDILLLYDEVQSGMGRTGDYFAYQTLGGAGHQPDVITAAKGLGGGMQLGAVIAREGVHQKLIPGTHGSTFGGHPVACAAACAVFETIDSEGLLDRCRRTGALAAARLDELKRKYGWLREVRQCGLMLGLELAGAGKPIVERCLAEGVLLNCTKETTIRLLPALNITESQLLEGLDVFAAVAEASAKEATGTKQESGRHAPS